MYQYLRGGRPGGHARRHTSRTLRPKIRARVVKIIRALRERGCIRCHSLLDGHRKHRHPQHIPVLIDWNFPRALYYRCRERIGRETMFSGCIQWGPHKLRKCRGWRLRREGFCGNKHRNSFAQNFSTYYCPASFSKTSELTSSRAIYGSN